MKLQNRKRPHPQRRPDPPGLTSPRKRNTQVRPIQICRGRGWPLIQDVRAFHKTVIPHFPVVPNPNPLLLQVPPDSRWFTVVGPVWPSAASRGTPVASSDLPLRGIINSVPGPSGCRGSLRPRLLSAKGSAKMQDPPVSWKINPSKGYLTSCYPQLPSRCPQRVPPCVCV